jgi:hypothetical protein
MQAEDYTALRIFLSLISKTDSESQDVPTIRTTLLCFLILAHCHFTTGGKVIKITKQDEIAVCIATPAPRYLCIKGELNANREV